MAMTNMKKLTVVCALGAVGLAQAQAYLEGSYLYGANKATSSVGTTESTGGLAAGIVGYQFHPNISVEGMLATGLTNDDIKLNGATQRTPVTQKGDVSAGAFVRAKAALRDSVEVFARLGRVEWRATSTAGTASASSNLTDWVYGLGLNYKLTKSMYLSGSVMSLYNKDNIKADGWSIGIGYKF